MFQWDPSRPVNITDTSIPTVEGGKIVAHRVDPEEKMSRFACSGPVIVLVGPEL